MNEEEVYVRRCSAAGCNNELRNADGSRSFGSKRFCSKECRDRDKAARIAASRAASAPRREREKREREELKAQRKMRSTMRAKALELGAQWVLDILDGEIA